MKSLALRTVLRGALRRLGYRLQRMSAEEMSYLRGYDTSVPLPPGADERLRPDHPLLLELERRYAQFDSPLRRHTQWGAVSLSTNCELRYFRGDNEYVWQYFQQTSGRVATPAEIRLRYYAYAQYVQELDGLGLLGNRLVEDGQFGCFTFRYPRMPTISRDLLDSVNELYFLDRQWDLFRRKNVHVLDIGAGYGRLAHRMLTATEGVNRYSCVDAVARSTYLCEYYLRFRKLLDGEGTRAVVIPLDEVASVLASTHIDLAVNVHGFSEMSREAIGAWVRLIAERAVPWLFVIPNEPSMLSRERFGARHEYRGLIEDAGYRLQAAEPVIRDADVRELYGAHDHFFLFRHARSV